MVSLKRRSKGGLYTLIFQRCQPSTMDYKVNFHLDATFKNPGTGKAAGMEWNYLSAGDALYLSCIQCTLSSSL